MTHQERGPHYENFEKLLEKGGVRIRQEGQHRIVELSNWGVEDWSGDNLHPLSSKTYRQAGFRSVDLQTGQITGSTGHANVSPEFLTWAKEKVEPYHH